jgi:hypothetical protein
MSWDRRAIKVKQIEGNNENARRSARLGDVAGCGR